MKTYSERIAKGTLAVLILGIAGTLLGYLLRIYLARSLSIAEFGLFYSVLAFLSFFGIFKDLGLGYAVAKMIPEFQVKKKLSEIKEVILVSIKIQFIAGVVISASLFLFAGEIAAAFFHDTSAKIIIQVLSIEFFIGFAILKAIIQGFQKVRIYASIEPARLMLVFIFLVIFMKLGAQGAALSYLAAAIIINIVLFLYTLRLGNIYERNRKSPRITNTLLRFGLTVFAGTVASMLIASTDTLMITFFLSLKDVALYQVAMSTSQLLLIFSSAIGIVFLPVVSEVWNSGKRKFLGASVSLLLKFLFIFIIPFVMIFVTFPEIFLNMVFGQPYTAASGLLQILSTGIIFYSLFSLMFTALIGIGKPGITTRIVIFAAILNFLLNLVLINIIGIAGAAVSALVSYIAVAAASYRHLRNYMEIDFHPRDIAKIFLCGAAATLAIFLIKDILVMEPIAEAIISLLVGFAVYSGLVLLSRTVKKSDIKMLDEINIRIPKHVVRFLHRAVRQ